MGEKIHHFSSKSQQKSIVLGIQLWCLIIAFYLLSTWIDPIGEKDRKSVYSYLAWNYAFSYCLLKEMLESLG